MFAVVVRLDVVDLRRVDWLDVVGLLVAKFWGYSMTIDYFLAYATLAVLAFGCVYVVVHNFIVEEIWKR